MSICVLLSVILSLLLLAGSVGGRPRPALWSRTACWGAARPPPGLKQISKANAGSGRSTYVCHCHASLDPPTWVAGHEGEGRDHGIGGQHRLVLDAAAVLDDAPWRLHRGGKGPARVPHSVHRTNRTTQREGGLLTILQSSPISTFDPMYAASIEHRLPMCVRFPTVIVTLIVALPTAKRPSETYG